MATRTVIRGEYPERSTVEITTTIRDLAGAALPGASLSTLVLTLYNDVSGTVINGRTAQNILNLNGGTENSSGGLTLRLDAADTIIETTANAKELRVALLEWTWVVASVTYSGKSEIAFYVKNLQKVVTP